jgi:hypothetical protein
MRSVEHKAAQLHMIKQWTVGIVGVLLCMSLYHLYKDEMFRAIYFVLLPIVFIMLIDFASKEK